RARRQKACDDRVGKQCELDAGRADNCRPEGAKELPHVGVEFWPTEFCQYTGYSRIACYQQELKHTGNENAPCCRVTGGRKESRKRQRNNQRQGEQDRRGSGWCETLARI